MNNRASANSTGKNEQTHKPSRATRLYVVWRKLRKSKMAVAGFGIVLFMSIIAVFAPLLAPDPQSMSTLASPPSMHHIFGTDQRGRDMLSLVIYGTSISMAVGVLAVLLEVVIGVFLGMIAGYFGGMIDEVLMRITDVVLTLPTLMLLIVTVSMFRVQGIFVMIFIMGGLGWPFLTRVVRSEYLSLRETTYVEAAQSMGASNWRIIMRHIFPNILSVVIVIATMDIPWYIFYEATLTFLGFGDPSSASWGVLLQRGSPLYRSHPWMITFPGLALLFTSLGFNLFGDGLRDALDVKVRE